MNPDFETISLTYVTNDLKTGRTTTTTKHTTYDYQGKVKYAVSIFNSLFSSSFLLSQWPLVWNALLHRAHTEPGTNQPLL